MAPNRTAPCERCDAEIPAEAIECPECGYRTPWTTRNRRMVAGASALAVCITALWLVSIVARWQIEGAVPAVSIDSLVGWLTPGLVGAALLYVVRNSSTGTATRERRS